MRKHAYLFVGCINTCAVAFASALAFSIDSFIEAETDVIFSLTASLVDFMAVVAFLGKQAQEDGFPEKELLASGDRETNAHTAAVRASIARESRSAPATGTHSCAWIAQLCAAWHRAHGARLMLAMHLLALATSRRGWS